MNLVRNHLLYDRKSNVLAREALTCLINTKMREFIL